MKMQKLFADHKVSKEKLEQLFDDASTVRLVTLFMGNDPERLLQRLKRDATLAFEVRLAASEGALEYADHCKAGKRPGGYPAG